jgi:excisionase family DNA binding protein
LDRLVFAAEDIGQLLGINLKIIQRLIDSGEIPSVRIAGGTPRVRRGDLEGWLDKLEPVAPEEKRETP